MQSPCKYYHLTKKFHSRKKEMSASKKKLDRVKPKSVAARNVPDLSDENNESNVENIVEEGILLNEVCVFDRCSKNSLYVPNFKNVLYSRKLTK